MVHHNQDQAPSLSHDEQPHPTQSNPPAVSQQQTQAYYQGQGVAYVAPPPPIGYPTKDGPAGLHQQHAANNNIPVETNTRGEGFWQGCVAALCCCWVLDFCVC